MTADAELLVGLAAADTALRARLAATGELFDGYAPAMRACHEANARAMAGVLDRIGWPSSARVGEAAAQAAWLVAQHAIGLPDFQRRCRALLQEAVARGEAPGWQLAFLEDRIAVLEGRPQRYGTQFDWGASGRLEPRPIEDADDVDRLRAELGLPPIAVRAAELNAEATREGNRPPGDLAERERAAADWARETGWR